MRLFGREWTRDQLEQYVGDISQIGGISRHRLCEGAETGVEVVEIRTGTGLRYQVVPSRGMDIGLADFGGLPLAWQSGTGYVHPGYYEESGNNWLRSFPGGLLVTCGLTYMGAASNDTGTALGLHGRAAHIPASQVCAEGWWQGDDYVCRVRGHLREVSVFGENVRLSRAITSWLGSSRIVVEDTVENLSFTPVEHMLLYHINLGYPLIGPESRLLAQPHKITPRDAAAAGGIDHWSVFQMPTNGFAEQVFYHELPTDAHGMATIAVAAPQMGPHGVSLQLRYRSAELPYLVQWKMCGKGTYVTGLEPATAGVMGRATERALGRVIVLAPREKRHYLLEMNVETLH